MAPRLLARQHLALPKPAGGRFTAVRPFSAAQPTQKSEGELAAANRESVLLAKTPEELAAAYDKWAEKYDADVKTLGGGVHARCCLGPLRKHATPAAYPRLLDMGCGTGLCAPHLQKLGWKDFVGVDLSAGMLKMARNLGMYKDLIQAVLPESGLPAEELDLIHSAGMFAPGQAPATALDEMVRLLRPGGLAVFSIRDHYYDNSEEGAEHKKKLEELVDEGKWRLLSKTTEAYLPQDGIEAYVFVMKKTEKH